MRVLDEGPVGKVHGKDDRGGAERQIGDADKHLRDASIREQPRRGKARPSRGYQRLNLRVARSPASGPPLGPPGREMRSQEQGPPAPPVGPQTAARHRLPQWQHDSTSKSAPEPRYSAYPRRRGDSRQLARCFRVLRCHRFVVFELPASAP